MTRVTPSAEPPREGFTTTGRPSRRTIVSRTWRAPSSRNSDCGSVTKSGVAKPGVRGDRLGDRLAPGDAALARSGTEQPQPEHLDDVTHGAVLAAGPVQERPDEIRLQLDERRHQVGVDVVDRDVHPDGAQGVGDAAAGSQRHVTLVGQTPGEDDDTG